jgi:hypothetical protein
MDLENVDKFVNSFWPNVSPRMAMENGSRKCYHGCKSYVTKGIILMKCTFIECMWAPM